MTLNSLYSCGVGYLNTSQIGVGMGLQGSRCFDLDLHRHMR